MKFFLLSLTLLFQIAVRAQNTAQNTLQNVPTLHAPGKITVGIVSSENRMAFEAKLVPFFKSQWGGCSTCELKNLTVYNEKGEIDETALLPQLEAEQKNITFLFMNLNWRYQEKEHKPLVELLKKIASSGTLVLGAAGYPKEGESSAQLNKTALGQVPDLIILGEINERERLPTPGFFGPQMLTAVKPPRDKIGQFLGPSFFVAKLAQNYTRKPPKDWLAHFQSQKIRSRKIWPQANDFFSR